jgi:hypothetical protein
MSGPRFLLAAWLFGAVFLLVMVSAETLVERRAAVRWRRLGGDGTPPPAASEGWNWRRRPYVLFVPLLALIGGACLLGLLSLFTSAWGLDALPAWAPGVSAGWMPLMGVFILIDPDRERWPSRRAAQGIGAFLFAFGLLTVGLQLSSHHAFH